MRLGVRVRLRLRARVRVRVMVRVRARVRVSVRVGALTLTLTLTLTTLTRGDGGCTEEALLRAAGSAERGSEHPIAAAIAAYAQALARVSVR